MIYIDTHVAAWLFAGFVERFPPTARDLMEENGLFISPMAVLELRYLREIGRLSVDAPMILGYLETAVALQVCRLPFHRIIVEAMNQVWTRDPFDRIIAAQARAAGRQLLTKDAAMREHCDFAVWD